MSSFYVRPLPSGNFRVLEEVWTDGERGHKTVPKQAYQTLGFRPDMTVEEAKARVKQLNQAHTIERKKAAATARRLVSIKAVESVFMPENDCAEFFEKLKAKSFGNDTHNRKILSHWQYVQRMIAELQIEPIDYADESEQFVRYFIRQQNSLDYVKKLLRILNMWGYFICKKRGQSFEPIPAPKGKMRELINDTYVDSDGFVGESDPLSPTLLQNKRGLFTVSGNFEWLFISVWFGLRPSEIDQCLTNPKYFQLKLDEKGTKILSVYQPKLTGIEREKRWKQIPILYPEQEQAIQFIEAGSFKRPIYKTMWRVFDAAITLYGGRKNFEDMMIGKGHRLEHVSAWMGHQNIQTTWGKYRNKKTVNY